MLCSVYNVINIEFVSAINAHKNTSDIWQITNNAFWHCVFPRNFNSFVESYCEHWVTYMETGSFCLELLLTQVCCTCKTLSLFVSIHIGHKTGCFESWLGHWLTWHKFLVSFLSLLSQIPELYLEIRPQLWLLTSFLIRCTLSLKK